MCQFKSAIVVKDEQERGGFRLLLSPWTESHSELITIHKLNDGKLLHFARVEFVPSRLETAWQPETYKLRIDEARTPDWFSEEITEKVTQKLSEYIKSIIVCGDVPLLIGGEFVVAPTAKIECAHSMVISVLCGGTVNHMNGGTVNHMNGGTVNCIRGGTVNYIRGGTVECITGGTVKDMTGGTVKDMTGGTVECITGGTVNYMTGGTVKDIRGGTVDCIRGGTVDYIRSGTVKEMIGGTVLRLANNWGPVIKQVSSSVKILNDLRNK